MVLARKKKNSRSETTTDQQSVSSKGHYLVPGCESTGTSRRKEGKGTEKRGGGATREETGTKKGRKGHHQLTGSIFSHDLISGPLPTSQVAGRVPKIEPRSEICRLQ